MTLFRWVGVLALVLVSATGIRAQEAIYEEGNRLYQAGDFPAAVEAYEAVLAGGFESGDLHYNLGNAYFKTGELGRAILAWERALVLDPGSEDALANLELARSVTVDDIEPLPRFWLFSVIAWWVDLIPRTLLVGLVGLGWIALCGGLVLRVVAREETPRWLGGWSATIGAVVVVVLGVNLAVREFGIGRPDRGVVLAAEVPVRSAPTNDDDLTLFQVHEGTRVRIDQRTDEWAEIVLDDGKVGWIPVDAMGII